MAYGKIGNLESDWAILGPVELAPSENPVLADKWGDLPTMFNGPRVNDILADDFDNPAEYGLEPPRLRLG